MAYPNFSNYPNFQYQPQYNSSIIWVQGIESAKAYPVAPGNSILLMDSETEQFYIKSADVNGMPKPLRIFSYEELKENTTKSNSDNFITRDEFDELKEYIHKNIIKKESRKDEPVISRNSKQQSKRSNRKLYEEPDGYFDEE